MKYSRAKTKKCWKETSDLDLVLVRTCDGNKNAIGLLSKTTSSHVHHAFLYISLPLMTTTRTKCLVSRFMEDVIKRRQTFLSTPGKLAYISYFQQIEINATKLEKMPIHFKSDVFAAVTFVDAKSP